MTLHGSCLCGGVEYEARGPVQVMNHCHCSRCRKAHGAAFATFAWVPADGFRWHAGEDLIRSFEGISPWPRQFCSVCGGNLPVIMGDQAEIPAGSLDDDPGIRPAFHIFAGSKAAFHDISDDLVQHEEYPPEWMEGGDSS